MTDFTYTLGIPAGSHNPSADYTGMQENYTSIDGLIAVDHFGFNDLNGGWHKQSTYPNVSVDPTTVAGQIALYSKQGAISSELFMIRDGNAGTAVNLTTSKVGSPSATPIGVSWLPGGILIQWGTLAVSNNTTFTPVSFTPSFPNACFNIVLTMINTQGITASANSLFVRSGSVSTTGFQIFNTSSSSAQSAYWLAIGN